MKLCPECKSDNIHRTSSTGLRVFGCIVLLFIPYGFFICWVPFIFFHTFACKNCGETGKERELIQIDWREREEIIEEFKKLQEKIKPYENMWFYDNDDSLNKILQTKNQPLIIRTEGEMLVPYRIKEFENDNDSLKIEIKKNLSPHYKVSLRSFDYENENNKNNEESSNLSKFGRSVITESEEEAFSQGIETFKKFLENSDKLLEKDVIIKIEKWTD